jgi:hypothetical protein
MKKSWIVLGIIALVVFLGITRPPKPATEEPAFVAGEPAAEKAPKGSSLDLKNSEKKPLAKKADLLVVPPPKKAIRPLKEPSPGGESLPPNAVKYVIDEGLAVVQGDAVVGVPVDGDGATQGLVLMPSVTLWKSREIAIAIQPNVTRPERIRQALEYFSDTVIRFVPYSGQEDVLVFEEGTGICKSYVGWVGGKQPVWISPKCEATEVAHEIMHALGFVHEQNRSDRDQFVEIMPDNIEEQFSYNFDKLPEEATRYNSLGEFDYESIMIYPPDMFAKSGQVTMRSKSTAQILPSLTLSPKDKERLQKAYGNL